MPPLPGLALLVAARCFDSSLVDVLSSHLHVEAAYGAGALRQQRQAGDGVEGQVEAGQAVRGVQVVQHRNVVAGQLQLAQRGQQRERGVHGGQAVVRAGEVHQEGPPRRAVHTCGGVPVQRHTWTGDLGA